MRILVSNDDGIHAPGIKTLARTLAREHEVWVFAPDRERSATGHALTLNKPLRINEADIGKDIHAWSVSGTPSDCIKIALAAIMPEAPDIVLSGINRGPNLGTDVIYSGTVSAAVEGNIAGYPSIAVSLCSFEDPDYLPAAEFALYLANRIQNHPMPPKTLLNVNVPSCASPNGVRITRLGDRRYNDIFEHRVDLRGRSYYWLSGELIPQEESPESDIRAIREQFISVTPIHYDLTCHNLVETLSDWNLGLSD